MVKTARQTRSSRRRKVTGKPRSKTSSKPTVKTDDTVAFPTQENTPPDDLSDVISCLYGRKGIGKTSLAAQFPNSLTFMFERGRRNLPIMQIPKKGEIALDWDRFKDYTEMFLESDEYQTMVVDTVDKAYDKCLEYVCAKNGCTHPP